MTDTFRLTPDGKWCRICFTSLKKGNIFRFGGDKLYRGIFKSMTDYRYYHKDFKIRCYPLTK